MKLNLGYLVYLLILTAMVTPGSPCFASSRDKTIEFQGECGVGLDAVEQLFANADGAGWKKYAKRQDFPEPASEWAEYASAWGRLGSLVAVVMEGAGQDFSSSSYYCYASSGRLLRVEYEFRTAWGWGYWESRSFENDQKKSAQRHFFDTKTEAVIPRPKGADDVHDAMKLDLYAVINKLPFFNLMSRAQNE